VPKEPDGIQINPLSPGDRGWIEGIIDGEGSLIVSVDKDGYVRFRLTIANNSIELIERAQKIIGGWVVFKKPKKNTKFKNKSYELRVARGTMEWLLPQLHFYTNEKELRRVAFLNYMAVKQTARKWSPGEREAAESALFGAIHRTDGEQWHIAR
jgi:hypothetical protein